MAAAESSTNPRSEDCLLFTIPVELQLSICELVVIEHQPLLLNCPCNSSFRDRGRQNELEETEKAWKAGTMHPPMQPAITQTCRTLRELALPIFYKETVFRACYCRRNRNIDAPIKWLRMIGPSNRELLRHLYFYDRNERQDKRTARDLNLLRESEIFTELHGKLETLSSKHCTAHLVTFGQWTRKEGEVPLASEQDVPRLRMLGEK
ncbi:hypothetical protein PRZ48_012967 [Zasmidium cellare]|uniref:Uncharacterized protein n=1 Tax=Zasmidium cellare TaxID=395010 RepID=A0ABR0E2Q2_ZASCE|nr:hypothetical protein PRZ48_012967 [Zasmidium cellare]